MDSDLIRGHVDTIILNILAEGDKYGYEIIDEVQKRSNGAFELKQPTLYSCLNRMEKNGLISSYWLDSDIGGKRHYYKLTDNGLKTFEDNQQKWIESRNIINKLIFNANFSDLDINDKNNESVNNFNETNLNDNYESDNAKKTDPESPTEANELNNNEKLDDSSTDNTIVPTHDEKEKVYYLIDDVDNTNSIDSLEDNDDINFESSSDLNKIYFKIDESESNHISENNIENNNLTDKTTFENSKCNKEDISFNDELNEDNDVFTENITNNFSPKEDSLQTNSEQIELFTDKDSDKSIEFDSDEDENRLYDFFKTSDKKSSQSFDSEEFENFVNTNDNNLKYDNFDIASYYSNTNESFYDANRNGEAVVSDYTKQSPTSLDSTEISPEDINFNINFNDDIDDNDDSSADEEVYYSFEEKDTDETSNTSDNSNEEKSYFNIDFDEDKNEEHIETDDKTSYDVSEKTIEENENNSDSVESYKKSDLQEVVKESSLESKNENDELFNRQSSLNGYKPRYTDADYQEILGDLASYSNSKLIKPNYNEKPITSADRIEKDFEETRRSLEKEGITVKLHSKFEKENPNSRSYVLTNKIKMVCSWIVFVMMGALLSLTYLIVNSTKYISNVFSESGIYFVLALCALIFIPITYSAIYYMNPMKKNVPKYSPKYSIIFALLFMIQWILLVYSVCIAFGFYSFSQTNFNHLNWLIPSVCSFVLLFSSIIYTILFRSKRFHV